jgi:hypothetical protein
MRGPAIGTPTHLASTDAPAVGHIRGFSGSYSKDFLLLIAIPVIASVSAALLPNRRVQS